MPWTNDDQKEWFEEFIAETERELCSYLGNQAERFPSSAQLLTRYRAACERLLAQGLGVLPRYRGRLS